MTAEVKVCGGSGGGKGWRVKKGLYILAGNDGLEGWVDGGNNTIHG